MKGLRGVLAGALTLIAVQVFSTGPGPERGGQLVAWLGTGVRALMNPEVPGVPRAAKAPPASTPKPGGGVSGSLPRNPTIQT